MLRNYRVGVIGGTGAQGRGIAYRLALQDIDVSIGSRSLTRAKEAANKLTGYPNIQHPIRGGSNSDVARETDLLILAVPYEGHRELVRELAGNLAGKIVVSCVNPIVFEGGRPRPVIVPAGSAALEAKSVAPDAKMVGAFHHLSAKLLLNSAHTILDDILVSGDDDDAKAKVIELASLITGGRVIDAGDLTWVGHLEMLTGVLISINQKYKITAGINISGF